MNPFALDFGRLVLLTDLSFFLLSTFVPTLVLWYLINIRHTTTLAPLLAEYPKVHRMFNRTFYCINHSIFICGTLLVINLRGTPLMYITGTVTVSCLLLALLMSRLSKKRRNPAQGALIGELTVDGRFRRF